MTINYKTLSKRINDSIFKKLVGRRSNFHKHLDIADDEVITMGEGGRDPIIWSENFPNTQSLNVGFDHFLFIV